MMTPLCVGAVARLVLIENTGDVDGGEPRIAILPPGPWAVPIAYPSMAAALAALRRLELGQ
jgi:hypothetical protein